MGNVAADESLILKNIPQETQQFIKEVIENSNSCERKDYNGRISIFWLIGISFFYSHFVFCRMVYVFRKNRIKIAGAV
ncbi:MAG: hypothetical protein UT50_C0030G0010 [Candidatus Moranbacteria bacterium GW2011_GWA2_39_41]|nr:MAG: hypothetical protein UT50_C0030G0010 [Candidatus Moranbacteria bacterium GW2011_GWA2_39_41]